MDQEGNITKLSTLSQEALELQMKNIQIEVEPVGVEHVENLRGDRATPKSTKKRMNCFLNKEEKEIYKKNSHITSSWSGSQPY